MSDVANTGGDRSAAVRPIVWTIFLWTIQIPLAAFFVMAGLSKLAGAPEMIALFDAVGIGQWFRYVTGVIEVSGAVLLLIPAFAGIGGLLLAIVMAGAIFTHLFVIGGGFAMPMILLAAAAGIAYARRARTLRIMGLQRASFH